MKCHNIYNMTFFYGQKTNKEVELYKGV